MKIVVELFDIPRRRVGAGCVGLEIEGDVVTLADVLRTLAERFPALAATCFEGQRLRPGYLCSVGGKRFVVDPKARLYDGDELLLMSAEAGG
ncbi:MAG: MoaD/ThiS family protein [Thermoguttaceae bacterium]